jgi:putative DNA primase/helicase
MNAGNAMAGRSAADIGLIAALKPWSRKPKPPRPKAEGPAPVLTSDMEKRYRAYALAGLERATAGLAALREGRPTELFRAVCALGWAVAHGVLSEAEFTNAFILACKANGLAARDGLRAIEASIRSGLQKAEHDPLPQLEDRPRDRDHRAAAVAGGDGGGTKTAGAPEANGNGAHPAKNDWEAAVTGTFAADAKAARDAKWQSPQPLPAGLPPVAAFDFDLLPDPLRLWAEDIVQTMQAPADFVGVAITAALGAVIGRKIGIRPQQHTEWTEVTNQWAIVIGRPGILKSPSIEAALAPLKALAASALADFKQEAGEREIADKIARLRTDALEAKARKALKSDPDASVDGYFRQENDAETEEEPPTLRRYISNDPTPAALGQLLIENPNGLLVYRDEIVSLLQSFEREDNAEGRGFYLTGWNGTNSYTFDRIVRGMNLHIPAVCVSMLGSTQPGKISRYLSAAVRGGSFDDGFIQRFGLMVWPDVSAEWEDVDRPLRAESKRTAFKLFKDLDAMNPLAAGAKQDVGFDGEKTGIPYLRFDNEALDLFRDWRGILERRLRGRELHPAMESHLAKYRKLVPSLALITHLANCGQGEIGQAAVLAALAWAEYLESHAVRAYASVTMPEVDAAKAIAEKMRSGALGEIKPTSPGWQFTRRDILRAEWSRLTDLQEVQKGLDLLVELDWLLPETESTGGRPKTTYTINPEVRP